MYIPGDDVDLVAALPLGVEALHAQLSVVQPILADSVPYLNERREENLNAATISPKLGLAEMPLGSLLASQLSSQATSSSQV